MTIDYRTILQDSYTSDIYQEYNTKITMLNKVILNSTRKQIQKAYDKLKSKEQTIIKQVNTAGTKLPKYNNINTIGDLMTMIHTESVQHPSSDDINFVSADRAIATLLYYQTYNTKLKDKDPTIIDVKHVRKILDHFKTELLGDKTHQPYNSDLKRALEPWYNNNNDLAVQINKTPPKYLGLFNEFLNGQKKEFLEQMGIQITTAIKAPEKTQSVVINGNQLTHKEYKPDTEIVLKFDDKTFIHLNIQEKFSLVNKKATTLKEQYYSNINKNAPYYINFPGSKGHGISLGDLWTNTLLLNSINVDFKQSITDSFIDLFGASYAFPLFITGLLGYIYNGDKTKRYFDVNTMPILIRTWSGYVMVSDILKTVKNFDIAQITGLWSESKFKNMLKSIQVPKIHSTDQGFLLRSNKDKRVKKQMTQYNKNIKTLRQLDPNDSAAIQYVEQIGDLVLIPMTNQFKYRYVDNQTKIYQI